MIRDIWNSFRGLPLWVQVWMGAILMPVNLLPLAFLDQPQGGLIAALAVTGMALNLPIMICERGFSKAMALPHVLFWTPLVVVVALLLTGGVALSSTYATFLIVLLVIDTISLVFDVNDSVAWIRRRATS